MIHLEAKAKVTIFCPGGVRVEDILDDPNSWIIVTHLTELLGVLFMIRVAEVGIFI